MSNSNEKYYKINGATLTGIANSIRAKNGSSDTYHPSKMEQAIEDIEAFIVPVDEDSESPQLVFGIDSGGFYISNNVNDKTDVKFGVDANGHVYVANGGSTNV